MGNTKQVRTVAVLGPNGMLGFVITKYFQSKGYHVISIDRKKFDVLSSDINSLSKLINSADLVVNCIGVIKPRITSMTPEDVLKINGIFPKNLAKLANQLKIPCFHITTDCVYSGTKGQYSENDYYDINDLYGLSKNAGESKECMTIRTSIIGEEYQNKYSLLEWAKSQKGKTIAGYSNHKWNGVTTLYLAEIIENIYRNNNYKKGIFHLFSPTSVTKYDLLSMINDAYRLNLKIQKEDSLIPIDRTMSSIYPLSKQIVLKELKQQILEMHNFFLNY